MYQQGTQSRLKPVSIDEIQQILKEGQRVLPRGGGTKPALSTPPEGVATLDMTAIAGMLDYEPSEFTFTALAGTPLSVIEQSLAEHGQFLPFDPLFVEHGATLGGTVAANASGPGRYRFGGVRDFILGVRFVNGQGEVVRGGGKVVKNSAGFDLPKLMVGSQGSLGILVELSFKVFPKPKVFVTLRWECKNLSDALQMMTNISSSRLDISALDLEPMESNYVVWTRLGGLADAMPGRLERLQNLSGGFQVLQEAEDIYIWNGVREFSWVPAGWFLVKVPTTPKRIPPLEEALAGKSVLRRYMSAGQVAWLAFEKDLEAIRRILTAHQLAGLVFIGDVHPARLGDLPGESFYRRVKRVLDPHHCFVEA